MGIKSEMTQAPLRTLIFGKGGQLGDALIEKSEHFGTIAAPPISEVNFLHPDTIIKAIDNFHPNLIINAAAYTDVDAAENHREIAAQINSEAVGVISEAAARANAFFIHFSTDYVFDGKTNQAYTESDPAAPINYYGETKLQGENRILSTSKDFLIFRTSWLYSIGYNNFVEKVLQWSRKQETLRIVTDQVGSPTWAVDLADLVAQITARYNLDGLKQKPGIYHLAGKGEASRLEWARMILELDPEKHNQQTSDLLPAKSDEFPTPARRPKYSALNCSKFETTFDLPIPDWQISLAAALRV
jgi:dTDP-4-dehydrorhamnose reductase